MQLWLQCNPHRVVGRVGYGDVSTDLLCAIPETPKAGASPRRPRLCTGSFVDR